MSMFHYRYASATRSCSKAAQRRLTFWPKTHLKCIKTHIETTINQKFSDPPTHSPSRALPLSLTSAGPLLNTWRRACTLGEIHIELVLFSVTGRTAKNGVVYKNNYRKPASTLTKQLHIKDFYCVFVRFAMNLIAFSGPRNCVNTQPYLGLCKIQFNLKAYYELNQLSNSE